MKDNIPTKRHPFLQGEKTLLDDIFEEDEEIFEELTPNQKADVFLSKYMEKIDPIVRYEKYFNKNVKGIDLIFREVKNYYKKTVIEKEWPEEKYIVVLDELFKNDNNLNIYVVDRFGKMYDNKALSSQKKTRKIIKRR